MKKITLCLLVLLAISAIMPIPALAENAKSPGEIKAEVANTALVVALILIIAASIMFVVKQQFSILAGFLGVSIVVITIIATEGGILVQISDWVAGWFGADVSVND